MVIMDNDQLAKMIDRIADPIIQKAKQKKHTDTKRLFDQFIKDFPTIGTALLCELAVAISEEVIEITYQGYTFRCIYEKPYFLFPWLRRHWIIAKYGMFTGEMKEVHSETELAYFLHTMVEEERKQDEMLQSFHRSRQSTIWKEG